MNKSSFHLAFLALLMGSLSGCASPMRLFAKKPQPFDEYLAQRKAEQSRIAGSQVAHNGQADVSELLQKGHAAFQQGNLQEAQSNYWAVVTRQPNHPVANHRLGVIADRQQDFTTAQRHYFAALNSSPNDANLLNDIGYSFLLQSRFAEAENYLQASLQKNPKQSNAINNLGLLYAKQGQADHALAMFRRTNSEAEAQAKLARLMPSAMPQAGTMLANQGWPSGNAGGVMAPYGSALNQAPANQTPVTNNGQPWTNELTNSFNGLPINAANNGWTQADPNSPGGSPAIAQAGASSLASSSNDPNLPEATRRLKEQMESVRLKAISDRQARDNAERQRQEMLRRQLRDEEVNRSSVVNAGGAQQRNPAWGGDSPTAMNSPMMVGSSTPGNNSNAAWPGNPAGQRLPNPADATALTNAWSNVNSVPNAAPMTSPGVPESMPGVINGPVNSTASASPLDAMPTWPPVGYQPAVTSNNMSNSAPTSFPSNTAAVANSPRSNVAEDQAWMASRMGMNAGPGTLFPITPAPPSTMPPRTWSNSSAAPNQSNLPQGFSPTTPPNWPANPNPQSVAPSGGEPPAGSFGPGNFGTSSNSKMQLPESAAQFALQEQLPPSGQYQTPGRFGESRIGPASASQSTAFATNRTAPGASTPQAAARSFPTPDPIQQASYIERASTRSTVPDRFGGDDRWEQGSAPGAQNAPSTVPTIQNFLSTPMGENSLNEYERMIQMHNDETNRIRQQIDAQRQLPGSGNYYRSTTQPQTSAPAGSDSRS